MQGAMGAIFSGTDVRDYKAVFTASAPVFPKEFELKTVRIKNQQSTGSCVAHSLSSIIEYYNSVQNGDSTEMSIGYIYGNRSTSDHKGAGMVMRDALEVVRKYGDIPKWMMPEGMDNLEVPAAIALYSIHAKDLQENGIPHRITQYCRVTSNDAIKASLYAGNPVLIAMNWYADMQVVDGVLVTNYQHCDGGHCMFIYGWDERGWKVQNSWGEDWGMNGTMIIPYDMHIEECWTLTDGIIEGITVKKPFSSKIGKMVAKSINKICNMFKNKEN